METKESVNRTEDAGTARATGRASSGAKAVAEDDRVNVTEAMEDVASSIEGLYHAADTFLGHHVRERPHVVLGAAAGIGFVLGGGLASRLGGVIVSIGGRLLVNRLLEGGVSQT